MIAEEFSGKRREPWPELKFLFDDYLASGDKVLDLGCGNGRFFEFCMNKNVDYLGIDPSEKLIEIAKTRYPQAKFQVGDAMQLPFPDNSFDKVYSIAVFHHIPSSESRSMFLEEARRVLKPNGLLILTVWKFSQPKMRFLLLKYTLQKLLGLSKLDFGDVLDPWGKTNVKRYYHWFSKKELAKPIEEVGLKVKKIGFAKSKNKKRQNIYLVAEK